MNKYEFENQGQVQSTGNRLRNPQIIIPVIHKVL